MGYPAKFLNDLFLAIYTTISMYPAFSNDFFSNLHKNIYPAKLDLPVRATQPDPEQHNLWPLIGHDK